MNFNQKVSKLHAANNAVLNIEDRLHGLFMNLEESGNSKINDFNGGAHHDVYKP